MLTQESRPVHIDKLACERFNKQETSVLRHLLGFPPRLLYPQWRIVESICRERLLLSRNGAFYMHSEIYRMLIFGRLACIRSILCLGGGLIQRRHPPWDSIATTCDPPCCKCRLLCSNGRSQEMIVLLFTGLYSEPRFPIKSFGVGVPRPLHPPFLCTPRYREEKYTQTVKEVV